MVTASKHPDLPEGEIVSGTFGGQDYAESTPAHLSLLGMTGMTAYFGLLDVGELRDGETVVVSGAAGAVGSVVGQLAKLKGCRVIGIAGGPAKCAWLVDRLADAARELSSWVGEGRLRSHEDTVRSPVTEFPKVFLRLFRGGNTGKLVQEIAS